MSIATPIWLAVAAVVALGVLIAHLISTSVPQRDPFPTARFVPEGAPLTVLRTRRLTDVLLLVLRVLAIALLGLALAGAHVARNAPARVVLVDLSRAVASVSEVADSVRAVGDVGSVIAFDSAAAVIGVDSLAKVIPTRAPRASLSAGLVQAHRQLAEFRDDRNKTELVLISPLVREEMDSATAGLLALWQGPIRLMRVRTLSDSTTGRVQTTAVRARGDDPVAAAISGLPAATEARAAVRVVRTMPTGTDSMWAQKGGVLVVWPADAATSGLKRLTVADTAQGIVAGADVVVGTFARTQLPRVGRTLVTWLDGSAAATELPLGAGCIREVAIPVDPAGDLTLRASFRSLVRRLSEPCGGVTDFAPVALAELGVTQSALVAGSSPGAVSGSDSPSVGFRVPANRPTREAVWLMVGGAWLLVAEQLLRRRRLSA